MKLLDKIFFKTATKLQYFLYITSCVTRVGFLSLFFVACNNVS